MSYLESFFEPAGNVFAVLIFVQGENRSPLIMPGNGHKISVPDSLRHARLPQFLEVFIHNNLETAAFSSVS
jgi:hypothetical protein